MKIFVYEFVVGGGTFAKPAPASLLDEGRAMWSAVLEDFARLPGTEVVTLQATTHDFAAPAGVRVLRVADESGQRDAFLRSASRADYTLLIAPEIDGALQLSALRVRDAGGRLLGPSPEAIALAADKEALCGVQGRLTVAGIPTPWSRHRAVLEPARRAARSGADASAVRAALSGIDYPMPAVVKPRFGAGSQSVYLVRTKAEWNRAAAMARAEGVASDLVYEPFVSGRAASVACLVGPAGVFPLTPATQELSLDGRFRYLGGKLPLPGDSAARAAALAVRAVGAVPGLAGWVGIDLVLGDTAAGDAVIEINPRPTTSYVGLRALYSANLAEAMLTVVGGGRFEATPPNRAVRFHPDGRLEQT